MPERDHSVRGLQEMEELARQTSPIHSLHPLVKGIVTIVYILVTTSFPKYGLSRTAVMMLYPAVLFSLSGISARTCFWKLRAAVPFVCLVGIANPFWDREILFQMGAFRISGGVVSMITLMLKGVLCLAASFLLAATTSVDALCAALRKIHVPKLLTTLLLLTCRYLSVMTQEIEVMKTAYLLRAPGQKGIRFSAWGSFLGQALLRSVDKAREIYLAMQLRGFDGRFWYAEQAGVGPADILFLIVSVCLFAVCRCVDIAEMIGNLIL